MVFNQVVDIDEVIDNGYYDLKFFDFSNYGYKFGCIE